MGAALDLLPTGIGLLHRIEDLFELILQLLDLLALRFDLFLLCGYNVAQRFNILLRRCGNSCRLGFLSG